LVSSVWKEYGLASSLAVLDLPKSTWYYHRDQKISYEEKYAHIRPTLEKVIRKHPVYGVPRITKELHENHELLINHKVIHRLLQSWDLSILRTVKKPRPSQVEQAIDDAGEQANLVAQMEQIGLFEVAYTDFANGTQSDGDSLR